MQKLTPKQKKFGDLYLISLNGKKAAEGAGYSKRTASVQAARLLANANVSAYIQKAMDERSKKTGITAERVLEEIAKLAFFDPRKLFNADGSPKHIHELDDDTAAAVAGLEINEMYAGDGDNRAAVGLVKKIKIADKGVNLERLGKHLKLFTDRVQVEGDLQLEIRDVKQKLLAKLAGRSASIPS